ncbi:hypothetical protein HYU13_04310 [Candidatus Woesearchaeota archaeon]|nr:hypothetical protein [Candidatus Woesearchaeota archaeon]
MKQSSRLKRLKRISSALLTRVTGRINRIEHKIRALEKLFSRKQLMLAKLDSRIRQRKTIARALSGKVGRIRKLMEDSAELQALRNENSGLVKENRELSAQISETKQNAERENNGVIDGIKHSYPRFPDDAIQRLEIERNVARWLMKQNNGTFQISNVLREIEKLYPTSLKPEERVKIVDEVKSWIEKDPLCRIASSEDGIKHYSFI